MDLKFGMGITLTIRTGSQGQQTLPNISLAHYPVTNNAQGAECTVGCVRIFLAKCPILCDSWNHRMTRIDYTFLERPLAF